MVLSQQDIEKAHDAFEKFDVDHSGCIDAWELKEAMKSLGQDPTDEEVFGLLSMVDTDGSGNIDFQVQRCANLNHDLDPCLVPVDKSWVLMKCAYRCPCQTGVSAGH